MTWLEDSALADSLRGLGVWSYGLINLVHIMGLSCLFGAIVILDLRLMQFSSHIAIKTVAGITVPIAKFGALLAIPSGFSMLTINTTQYFENPFFYLKLPLLGLALANFLFISRTGAWRREINDLVKRQGDSFVLASAGFVSLLLWTGVLTCGRMIGYW